MNLALVASLRSWLQPARRGRREPPSIEQVREVFERDPARCFTTGAGAPYRWEVSSAFHCPGWVLDNITVRTAGVPIAWVQEIALDTPRRCATLGHFAIDMPYVGHGFGRLLAITLRAELRARLGVSDLVFAERSSRYAESGYEAFFRALGATKMTPRPGWRADWLWQGQP